MENQTRGICRPRPIRVAFLVQDTEHAHLALDGIFADCYARWGGRFSLIVPCIDHNICSSYWPWLETYDPDIVYSYVTLSSTAVLEIHERLYPAEYLCHEHDGEPRLDVFGFKPRYDFEPLSSLSIAFRRARHSPSSRITLIDSWHTEGPSRFLTDNLGTYHHSYSTGMFPNDARSAVGLLTIVSPDKLQDRSFGIPSDLQTTTSESMAFAQFGAVKAMSLSLLSALDSPRLEIQDHPWSGAFNLVVGDSFADRIIFWNLRLLIPTWLDTDLCCLRIDAAQLDDVDFPSQLVATLNHRNHVNGGRGGQSQIALRSSSHSLEQLQEVLTRLPAGKLWSFARAYEPLQLDCAVPSAKALEKARELTRAINGQPNPAGWTSFQWTAPVARPPVVEPEHLADAPPRQAFARGYWATDFAFEHDEHSIRFAQENRWALPKRWRMAGAFRPSFTRREAHSLPPRTRRSGYGNFTLFVNAGYPVEQIDVPSPRDAFQYAFCLDGRYVTEDPSEGAVTPPRNKVRWARESNEARYLTGVLGMAGGLGNAGHWLLHPFLRGIFAKLGGAPNLADTDVSGTVNALKKRGRRRPIFDLSSDDEINTLSGLIVRAAQSIRAPLTYFWYEDLKEQWKVYCARYWEARASEKHNASDTVDRNQREKASLDDCLVDLRGFQLLFQGHQWTCSTCHHKNWIDLSALSLELGCAVCKQAMPAPVNIRWQFQPNEFLIESLRSHSVLSLIWVLSALRDRARNSFIYAGPTCLSYSDDHNLSDGEIDLLAIVDGEAFLCEVKSAWRSVRSVDIDDLVSLAIRLRPDVALLAQLPQFSGLNLVKSMS